MTGSDQIEAALIALVNAKSGNVVDDQDAKILETSYALSFEDIGQPAAGAGLMIRLESGEEFEVEIRKTN